MTAAALEKHCLTHLPYHPGCPICAATRKPNQQHRKSHEASKVIPLRVGEYGFARNTGDDSGVCVLSLKLYLVGILFASCGASIPQSLELILISKLRARLNTEPQT